jgi:glycosyltransferase involved in cell wall biosynthesis
MRIFVIGSPADLGGAAVEAYHAARLWREHGVEVAVVPTWEPHFPLTEKLGAVDIPVVRCLKNRLWELPGVRGSILVSFGNHAFLTAALEHRRRIGAKLVWLRCQLDPLASEESSTKKHGPFDAYVSQSRCLHHAVQQNLREWGLPTQDTRLIPGAFHVEDFAAEALPHENGEPFVIGRLSRDHPNKYTRDCWDIFEQIKHEVTNCHLKARVMGWRRTARPMTGKPPDWIEVMPPEAEPVPEFLGSLHALVQFGDVLENWPRVGLEAMAAGVPIITQNRGGWQEMIRHGTTGYLCDNAKAAVIYASELARNESRRLAMAEAARERVEELADPEVIWAAWEKLFGSLT